MMTKRIQAGRAAPPRSARHSLRIAAMVHSAAMRSALETVSGGINGHRFDFRDAGTGAEPPEADALIFEAGRGDDEAAMRTLVGHLPLIVVGVDLSAHDVRRFMRLGAVDVLPAPFAADDILAALDRIGAKTPDAAPGTGRIVAVMKAGGGVGATSLAVQLGCVLARSAAETAVGPGGQVCLVDLDLQFGTAALYLDLQARAGVGDLLEAPDRLDASLVRGAATRHETGLEVIAAPPALVAHDSVSPALVSTLLELAAAQYRHVLVDMPPDWTAWSYAALLKADLVLLIAQPGVSGVHQARRQLDALEAHGIDPQRVRLVLNRHDARETDRALLKEAEAALGRSFDSTIARDDATMRAALDKGLPLDRVKRGSAVERDIRALVDAVFATGETKRTGWFPWPFGQRRS